MESYAGRCLENQSQKRYFNKTVSPHQAAQKADLPRKNSKHWLYMRV